MLGSVIFLLMFTFTPAVLAQDLEGDVVEVESEAVYTLHGKDSEELARALTLFEANRKAVEIGAKYLATRGLIGGFEERKNEIYALAAGALESRIIEERRQTAEKAVQYLLRIRAHVKESDFVQAEILDRKLQRQESTESFQEEMEPAISKKTDPGIDIAKAYLMLRNRDWRMAVIYLDRLEIKYPHWGRIHMARAIGYYALQEHRQMKTSLEKACGFGNEEACEDLKRLKKVHTIELKE